MNDQPSLAESPTTHSLFASLMALAPMNDVQVIPAEAATAVERLAVLRDISANVTARTRHWVERAREDGATWQQIGEALDLTRQAAQQRYGTGNA